MKIVEVEHRDVYVITEFSLQQLKWLEMFLSHCVVEYASKEEPEMVEADNYVKNKLFPELIEFIETIGRG